MEGMSPLGKNYDLAALGMQKKEALPMSAPAYLKPTTQISINDIMKQLKLKTEGRKIEEINIKDLEEIVSNFSKVLHKYDGVKDGKVQGRAFSMLSAEERLETFKAQDLFAVEESETGQVEIAMPEEMHAQALEEAGGELKGADLRSDEKAPPRSVTNVAIRNFTAEETKLMITIHKTYLVYEATIMQQQISPRALEESSTSHQVTAMDAAGQRTVGRTTQTTARAGEAVERRMEGEGEKGGKRLAETQLSPAGEGSKQAAKKRREEAAEAEREDIKRRTLKESVTKEEIKKTELGKQNVKRDKGVAS